MPGKSVSLLNKVVHFSRVSIGIRDFDLKPKPRAVVIGGGFIGLEMVENLAHCGFEVTLVEMLDQVLPPIDKEHAQVVEAHLKRHGVHLALADGVAGFKQAEWRPRGRNQIRRDLSG